MSKYEAVMKTEPNVPHFTLLAKERMCHALAQVRPLQIWRDEADPRYTDVRLSVLWSRASRRAEH